MEQSKMTSGRILGKILTFAGPVLAGQLLQQLYSIVDTVIVGRYLGVEALAAVGATWSLTYIVCYFCIGTCTGISVPLSQAYGAGDEHRLRCYFINGVYFVTVLALVVTTVTSAFSMQFLKWLKTPENIIDGANTYLFIMFAGLPFTILYNFCFGVLIAFGDGKRSSAFMALSTVLNLILDWVTVVVWKWGIAGAGISTIISEGVAGMASLIYILKKYTILCPKENEWKLQMQYVLNIIRMSVPMGLQYSITAIGAIILQFSVNNLDSNAIAGYSTGSKVKGFFLCPLNALGTALSAFVGQNMGAKKYGRIREGFRKTLEIGILYSVIVIVLMIFFREKIALLFVKPGNTQVLEYIKKFIMYISVFNLELAVLFTARFCVQGMGYGKYSIYSGLAEMAGRSLVAIFLVPVFEFEAVCWNEGVTFLAGILVIVPVYLSLMRKLEASSGGQKKLPFFTRNS